MPAERFSEVLYREARTVWDAILEHPFLEEVQDGTLPLEKFRYYIVQDYHYLEGFGRTVAIALSRAPDSDTLRQLLRRVTTPVERPLHGDMFRLLGIDEAEAERTTPAPTNLAYVNHMVVTASSGGTGEAAAALLPCPWTYHEVGSRLTTPDHPVFQHWLGAYSSGLLEESTAAWRSLVDTFGERYGPSGRDAMSHAFMTSCRYEYMFWTMAYTQEQWPI